MLGALACALIGCTGEEVSRSFNESLRRGASQDDAMDDLVGSSRSTGQSFSDALGRANRPERQKPFAAERPDARKEPSVAVNDPPIYAADQVEIAFPDWLVAALAARLPRDGAPSKVPCAHPRPVNDVRALVAPGHAMVHCCGALDADPIGCAHASDCKPGGSCSYFFADDDSWMRAGVAERRSQVLGPIRSKSEAIGHLALSRQNLLLAPGRYPEFDRRRQSHVVRLVSPTVTPTDRGFEVVVVQLPTSSCPSSLQVLTTHVNTDGSIHDVAIRKLIDTRVDLCVLE